MNFLYNRTVRKAERAGAGHHHLLIALATQTALIGICATPAFAQTDPKAKPDSPPEIVVTARKRSESLQDVPVAISVRSGEELEKKRIKDVEDLVLDAPGLFLTQNQSVGPAKSETYITLRGVGATTPLEPAVAVFLDGVYQPKLAFDIGFLELEQVEILRGPQGALFGRNTQGGAINMVSKKPSNYFEGKVLVGIDEHETYTAKAYVNGPLVEDRLFASIALQYSDTQGYIYNATLKQPQDDKHTFGGRASLRFVPTDNFEATLTVQGSTSGGGQVGVGVPSGSKQYLVYDNDVMNLVDDVIGGSLKMDWEIGGVSVTSITGYSDVKSQVFFDIDGGSLGTGNFQRQSFDQRLISEELRLSSNTSSPFQWLVGLYYFNETYDQFRNFSLLDPSSSGAPTFNPANAVSENADFDRDGWAIFGQLTYEMIENLELSLGGRYSSETIDARQFGSIVLTNVVTSVYDNTSSETFTGFSPQGSISYKWGNDVLTYATISRGYKAGGFPKYPFFQAATGIPFDSETSTNYELGVKADLADGAISISAAAYIIDIKDQQLATQVNGPANVPVEAIDNVGSSQNKGFELETVFRPFYGFQANVSASYINAEFKEYVDQNGTNRAGERVPYIPEWSVTAGAQYTHAIGNGGAELTWSAKYSFIDSYIVGNGTGTFDPRIPIKSFDFIDISAELEINNWTVSVYVDNVTDEFNVIRTYQSPFHNPAQFSFDSVLRPRTIGAQVSLKF